MCKHLSKEDEQKSCGRTTERIRFGPGGKLQKALAGSLSGHPAAKVATAPPECGRFVAMDRSDYTNILSRRGIAEGGCADFLHRIDG